jgi:uncharacterized membrane protein YdjX (TVP38/TMEM64 family)
LAEQRKVTDWLRLAIPIAIAATFVIAAWRLGYFHLEKPGALNAAAARAQATPWLGPIFVGVYAAIAALAAPVSPLAYGAGAVFGLVKGSAFVWIGSMIGGSAGYWLARGVSSGSVRRLLQRHEERLRGLKGTGGFLTTFRLQLLPIVPFGIFNYAAGAARVPFLPFLGRTPLGIIPGTVAAEYIGDRIAAGFRGSGREAFIVAAIVMLALIGLSFIPSAFMKQRA